MQNNLLIALTALTLMACTSNLHALTKTRALAQATTAVAHNFANYARQNKLKTAGMVIGGAIAFDALQVGARWSWWRLRKDDAKIKAAQEKVTQAREAAWTALHKANALSVFSDKQRTNPDEYQAYKEAYAARQQAWEAHDNAAMACNKLLFNPEEASLICIPLLGKLVQQAEKFRDWRRIRKARRGL